MEFNLKMNKAIVKRCLFFSSKRAVDESEVEAAERRHLRCVWVTGGRALTEHEAAVEIVSQARLLLQEDLVLLGIRWDPATLPPEAVDNPDNHRNDIITRSASPQEEHVSSKDEQERNMVKTRDCNGTDDSEKENKAEYQHKNTDESKREHGNLKPGENIADAHSDKRGINDRTEPGAGQSTDGHVKRCKEMKNIETNGEEDVDIQIERQNQEMDKRKGILPLRSESDPANHPVVERSLTQELAEIISSPLPELISRPQLSLSPVTPSRFRAPASRVEARHTFPPNISERHRTTSLVASPVHPGRLEHARVLTKVLHSIQMDKSLPGNVQVAPAGRSSAQDPAPEGQASKAQAPFQGAPVRAPGDASNGVSPLSVSPASAFLPEAKRRRRDGAEVDAFSSPELYAGYNRDEDTEGDRESFGDSFELDTQTEKMIAQPASPHRGGAFGMNRSAETDKTREKELVVAEEEQGTVTNKGWNGLGTDNGCSRLSISITESQMEFILNNSQEVSDLTFNIIVIIYS